MKIVGSRLQQREDIVENSNYIILGIGLGRLSAAAYLTRQGCRVAILISS